MADAFDAFFGVGAGLGEDSQPMIDALRGQKREGDFASLSTVGGISDFGKGQSRQALAAGKHAGGLKMAREAEQRKVDDEASRFTRGAALAKTVAAKSNQNKITAAELANQNKVDAATTLYERREVKPPKKMGYGDAELYQDDQGNEFWGMEGDDGVMYRDTGIANAPLQKISRQGLTKVVEEQKGSQAASKKSVPLFNGEGGVLQGFQREGKFYDNEGNALGNEWTEHNPNKKDSRGGTGVVKLNASEARKMTKDVRNASQAYGALSNMEPDFGNEGGIPLKGRIEGFITTYAPMFSTEKMDRKGEGWKQLLRFNDMLKKNEMFGSALSKGENKNWVEANINKDSTPAQVEAYVNMLKRVIGQEMSGSRKTNSALYGDDLIDIVYADWDNNAYKPAMKVTDLGLQPPANMSEEDAAFWATLNDEDKQLLLDDMQGGE